jgi:hypothetical protein
MAGGNIMTEPEQSEKKMADEHNLLVALTKSIHSLNENIKGAKLHKISYFASHPFRFLMFNFVLGMFRGLGIAVGMTIIFALLAYLLSRVLTPIVSLPVIGQFVAEIIKIVEGQLSRGIGVR